MKKAQSATIELIFIGLLISGFIGYFSFYHTQQVDTNTDNLVDTTHMLATLAQEHLSTQFALENFNSGSLQGDYTNLSILINQTPYSFTLELYNSTGNKILYNCKNQDINHQYNTSRMLVKTITNQVNQVYTLKVKGCSQ